MKDLKKEIVKMIISRCNLVDVSPDFDDYDAPIFVNEDDMEESGFELDSVDALELVAGVKEKFGVTVEAGNMNVFRSVNTLAAYLEEKMASV